MIEEKKSTDEEKKVDNSSSVENIEQKKENSASVKDEVKSEKKPSLVMNIIMAFVVFLVLVGAMLFPFNSRTILGRVFDLVGAHKLAMGTDAFVNRQNNLANLASHVDVSNKKSFVNSWNKVKKSDLKFEAVSMKNDFVVYPVNEEYTDSLRAGGGMDLNFSLKDQKVSGDINFNVDAKLSEVSEDYQNIEANLSVLGAVDNEKAYFKLEEGKMKLEGMNMSFGFDDWYSSENFDLSDEQKGALNEIASLITEFTETSLSQIMSDETGRQFMTATHNFYDGEIEVGGIKKVEFGQGDNKVTKKVREVSFKDVNFEEYEDSMKSFGEESFDGVDMLLNDQTFQNFVKNDFYNWVEKVAPQVAILEEDENFSNDSGAKEDFEKEFDEVVKEFNENKDEVKDVFLEDFNESTEMQMEIADFIESVDYTVYFEPGTNNYYGYKVAVKIKVPEDILAEIESGDENIHSIVKDGIVLEAEVYDIYLNDQVDPVSIPENAKSFEEFMKAMENDEGTTSFFGNLEMIMNGLFGGSVSSANGSQIYQDETGAMLYYDQMTGMDYEVYESQDGNTLLYLDPITGEHYPIPQDVVMQYASKMTQESQSTTNQNSATGMTAEEQAEIEKLMTN